MHQNFGVCSRLLGSWLAEANWFVKRTGWEKKTPSTPLFGIVFATCAADLPLLFESHQFPTALSDEAKLLKIGGQDKITQARSALFVRIPWGENGGMADGIERREVLRLALTGGIGAATGVAAGYKFRNRLAAIKNRVLGRQNEELPRTPGADFERNVAAITERQRRQKCCFSSATMRSLSRV